MILERSAQSIGLGLFLALISCSKGPSDEITILRWVESSDPIQDAQQELLKGNHVLKAVRGESTYLPGISPENQSSFMTVYGYSLIQGTSDSLNGPEHVRLNKLATRYAEQYNQYIVTHFNTGGHKSPA